MAERFDQSVARCLTHAGRAVADLQQVEQGRYVRLHRTLGEVQAIRDRLVRMP